ncbi:uncharacterized protein K460DRAFT_367892 [Cucurbitaria berberidis CBS 394.84]|uniref:Uncharacterized protein n=1 Tax=Cucurbitaria berberidis CBS 394.84 TaxID=1168544 RepID=A0A9P4L666_9PLEO|nr:uncharacterized protein K460DRAFT_367892 [Cucurbitaria berberidis CBS 394.84]KAF1842974.1 hypothetical protein K460DRAFT_367892 [Cucurbitaria berberidis CBS 394.84]
MVWETQEEQATSASGKHHIFLTGDATPRPLEILNPTQAKDNAPVTIIYDSRSAALYYDCPEPEAVRNSVTLDFHLNTITDSDIQLLSASSEEMELEEITLTKLLTSFPVVDYTTRFHRLLFDTESLNAIVAKLATIDVPTPQPVPNTSKPLLERFEIYKRENWARVPPLIKSIENDIPISGTYSSAGNFLDTLIMKARRDVHLPIGMNLFPQTPLAENRECARKLVRDLPGEFVEDRLMNYASTLTVSYTSLDLLSTLDLHKIATQIERRCLEIIVKGFVDNACHIPSIAALASAFGSALNGSKEIHVAPEPWVDDSDMQVYRTRCLYLFWCADWLVCYLGKPEMGPFMVIDGESIKEGLVRVRAEIGRAAQLLLRNWAAWSMFVEGLPKGGFFVRRPGELEEAG